MADRTRRSQNVFFLLALGSIQSAKLSIAEIQGLEVAEKGPHSLDLIMYISASASVSLLASAWMFYRVTGGLFNPAVSLAALLIGQIEFRRFALYVVAQLMGGISASAIIHGLSPGPVLFRNKLGKNINLAQGVFIEMFCSAILMLAILMLAAEKHKATPIAPIGISMTLFACHTFALPFTGASMNPARSFGPAVIGGFERSHWVYWVGPFSGVLLAVTFYAWLKHTKYWHLNPEQMATQHGESPEDPVAEMERIVHRGRSRGTDGPREGSSSQRQDEKV